MDSVDSGSEIVGVEFFLEQFEGIKILHKIQFNININLKFQTLHP